MVIKDLVHVVVGFWDFSPVRRTIREFLNLVNLNLVIVPVLVLQRLRFSEAARCCCEVHIHNPYLRAVPSSIARYMYVRVHTLASS